MSEKKKKNLGLCLDGAEAKKHAQYQMREPGFHVAHHVTSRGRDRHVENRFERPAQLLLGAVAMLAHVSHESELLEQCVTVHTLRGSDDQRFNVRQPARRVLGRGGYECCFGATKGEKRTHLNAQFALLGLPHLLQVLEFGIGRPKARVQKC